MTIIIIIFIRKLTAKYCKVVAVSEVYRRAFVTVYDVNFPIILIL